MTVLEVKNLSYSYGSGTPFYKKALSDISFKIEKGEFVAIIGHTGSGKSTLVSHLNALTRAQSGTVILNGEDIYKKGYNIKKARQTVGLVFQYPEYQLFEETVYRDIAFGPKNMGLSESEIKSRVISAASALEIDKSIFNVSPFELSGGQKRRVAIAGVIAMNPEILVLDEPAAGLDPKGRDRVMRLIAEYRKNTGNTVIIVSHSMQDAAKYADRVLVLNEGKLYLNGTVDEVFERADELESVGLSVPPITKILIELHKKGYAVPLNVYTAEDAAKALLPLLKKEVK